ncbi:hypothetical protein [Flavobacterium sp.]
MKKLLSLLFLLFNLFIFAQKPCEIDTDITDSLGTYKSTKQFMIYERSFAGNATNIYFSLASNNGVLNLELQSIQSSNEFIKANCLDKNSKIYLQLNNGKIITLLNIGAETCGTFLRSDDGKNNRVLSSSFVFTKDSFEDLKTSKVTFMRVQFSGETLDYPFKTEFVSEVDKKSYQPERYFMDYLKCIID